MVKCRFLQFFAPKLVACNRLNLPFLVAAVFAGLPLALLPLPSVVVSLALVTLVTLWLVRLLLRWLGGYTGDCLGATQQLAELAFYLGLLAQWPRG